MGQVPRGKNPELEYVRFIKWIAEVSAFSASPSGALWPLEGKRLNGPCRPDHRFTAIDIPAEAAGPREIQFCIALVSMKTSKQKVAAEL